MKNKKYKLSDNAILFIKKYALDALGLKMPLTEDDFFSIMEYAMDCELSTLDDNGDDLPEEIKSEEGKLGDLLGTEMSFHTDDDIDLEDLNRRLQ